LRKSQQTAIYVTHDQEEAFAVASRIILMNKGKVLQIGTPLDIYQHPGSCSRRVFLGLNNIVPGVIRSKAGSEVVETSAGGLPLND